jgi:hypothetical protein
MTDDEQHYTYEHEGRRVHARLNDGHNGSVLNCTHPACVAVRQWAAGSDEHADDDEITQAMAREMATKGGCEFHFSATSMLRAVGLLQLAARHPEISDEHQRFIRTFVEHARAFFADCPTVLAVIAKGDDPRQDRPWKT